MFKVYPFSVFPSVCLQSCIGHKWHENQIMNPSEIKQRFYTVVVSWRPRHPGILVVIAVIWDEFNCWFWVLENFSVPILALWFLFSCCLKTSFYCAYRPPISVPILVTFLSSFYSFENIYPSSCRESLCQQKFIEDHLWIRYYPSYFQHCIWAWQNLFLMLLEKSGKTWRSV